MSTLSLLHQDGNWLAFNGDEATRLAARPKIDRATVVITDFDGAVSQVIALEGSTTHAVALIEKRLRADGLIDNESKIHIHKTRTVGNGYQALFTAVPLDSWQQMVSWAEGQADHCMLVPSVALLWQTLKPGRGIVLHSGRQIVFLAALGDRMVHAAALAFSDSENDLAMTVTALAERASIEISAADDALEALTIDWYGALTRSPDAPDVPDTPDASVMSGATSASIKAAGGPLPGTAKPASTITNIHEIPTQRTSIAPTPVAPVESMTFDGQTQPDDAAAADDAGIAEADARPAPRLPEVHSGGSRWLDEVLLELFSEHSGASVRLGPHEMVRDADGVVYRTGVPHLAASASAMVAVNPPASRAMYLAERLLPWASVASLLLAVALGGLGGRWALGAHQASTRAEDISNKIITINQQTAQLEQRQALPESYPQLAKFIARIGTLQNALDPHSALVTVREAAAEDVRILRLRLDGDGALRVDGMVNHAPGDSSQDMQIARFVARLRAAGFNPIALDPQTGSARAQSPGGSFSYRLERASVETTGDAS